MSFEDQRHYIILLCLKGGGELDAEYPSREMRDEILAHGMGLQIDKFREVMERLQARGLVDKNLHPKAWEKRQYVSDNSTKRVQKHRMKRSGNVSVTPSDTDTDTDTDTDSETEVSKRYSPETEILAQQNRAKLRALTASIVNSKRMPR